MAGGEARDNRPTVVELFAGGGGLSMGLSIAGFRHLSLIERDPVACRSLRDNVALGYWTSEAIVEGDVRRVDMTGWRDVDVCAAGVPCQPFSKGGLGNGHEDERNLFPALLDAIRVLRPKVVVIENVFGLVGQAFGSYLQYVVDELRLPTVAPGIAEPWRDHWDRLRAAQSEQQPAYAVDHMLLDAADFGTAQRRRRVFVLAVRRDLGATLAWPRATHSKAALAEAKASGEYWKRHDLAARAETNSNLRDSRRAPWRTLRDAIEGLGPPVGGENQDSLRHTYVPGARPYTGHTGSRLDEPAKTLKAGVHGVAGGEATVIDDNGNLRYLTLREVARLQDFPDDYCLPSTRTASMRLLGNAVPVALATALGRTVFAIVASGAADA